MHKPGCLLLRFDLHLQAYARFFSSVGPVRVLAFARAFFGKAAGPQQEVGSDTTTLLQYSGHLPSSNPFGCEDRALCFTKDDLQLVQDRIGTSRQCGMGLAEMKLKTTCYQCGSNGSGKRRHVSIR